MIKKYKKILYFIVFYFIVSIHKTFLDIRLEITLNLMLLGLIVYLLRPDKAEIKTIKEIFKKYKLIIIFTVLFAVSLYIYIFNMFQ